MSDLINMEVRDGGNDALLGWLLVPQAVYQGHRDSWNFELRQHYGDRSIRRVCLPVVHYRTPAGHTCWVFRATADDLQLLREVAVFASAP